MSPLLTNLNSLRKTSRDWTKPVTASLLCITLIFILHFILPSYVNGLTLNKGLAFGVLWHSEHADDVFIAHTTFSEFARRPITTGIQSILKNVAGIPFQFSFNLIAFTALLACSLVLHKISSILSPRDSKSHISIYGFMLSYSVLFSFMGPMHSYDEPLQYLFLLLAFLYLLRDKPLVAALLFSLACMVRESSFILLPFYLFYNRPTTKGAWCWGLPLIIYGVFLLFVLPPKVYQESILFSKESRLLLWTVNFQGWGSTMLTLVDLFLTTALPFFLIRSTLGELNGTAQKIFRKAAPLVCLNAIIVLISGLAREPRLFTLPLLLLFPLLPASTTLLVSRLKKIERINWVGVGLAVVTSFVFSFIVFGKVLNSFPPLYNWITLAMRIYLFVYLLLMILMVGVSRQRSPKTSGLTNWPW